MTRRFSILAWSAAVCTYLLIVLGAVVRITGSGLGCGDHWPLCNGHLFPPLEDIGTVIEWSHRLLASVVSVLVTALAFYAWRSGLARKASYSALALIIPQVLLGAITVKTGLTPAIVVLHLATAMLLLAALLIAATASTGFKRNMLPLLLLTFVTVLFGALTANLGAAAACHGFPLCNGEIWMSAGPLAWIHWIHRLLAYALAVVATVWAVRTRGAPAKVVLGLVVLQIAIGAATVLLGLPSGLQAAHVAVGSAVWAAVVLAQTARGPERSSGAPSHHPPAQLTDS
jgi:heme a synthase